MENKNDPLLSIVKDNWMMLTTTGFIAAQVLAVTIEQYKLRNFGVEFLSIAQLQDLPLILLRYPEMIMFVLYSGFAVYSYFSFYRITRSEKKSTWDVVTTRRGFSLVALFMVGWLFCVLFWFKSEPMREVYHLENGAFTRMLSLPKNEDYSHNCYGYITSTSKYFVLYDQLAGRAITIDKSMLSHIQWTYLPSFVSNTKSMKCTITGARYDSKNSETRTKVVPL